MCIYVCMCVCRAMYLRLLCLCARDYVIYVTQNCEESDSHVQKFGTSWFCNVTLVSYIFFFLSSIVVSFLVCIMQLHVFLTTSKYRDRKSKLRSGDFILIVDEQYCFWVITNINKRVSIGRVPSHDDTKWSTPTWESYESNVRTSIGVKHLYAVITLISDIEHGISVAITSTW